MSHTFSVSIYQRRAEGQLDWRTVGLGAYLVWNRAKGRVKLQRKMVEALRKTIEKAPIDNLDLFRVFPGTRLERIAIGIGLRGPEGRTRFAGTIPLICQPRVLNDAGDATTVVFHPLLQDQWFTVDDGDDLVARAQTFFRQAWAGRTDEELDQLKSDGKDSLRSISFSAEPRQLRAATREEKRLKREPDPVLVCIGADQTQRAIERTLPTGMPRYPYRQQLQRLLCGTRKRSTLVVGASGVGKSTLINRVVADLVESDGFAAHRNLDRIHKVWRVNGKRIIAGMSFMGDWERRCLDLVDECKRKRAILWIEDLHLFGRLGQTRQSERSLAQFFRGPVQRGEVVVIGECTPEQLSRFEDEAPSLAALLPRVHVAETSPSETLQTLLHRGREVEVGERVELTPFVYRSILEMGQGLYPWSSLPGRALDILDQLAAYAQAARKTSLVPSDVVAMLSARTGLPENLLTLDAPMDLDEVREAFATSIVGQPEAVDTACDLVSRVRSGLNDAGRPLAVYLFTGPTGTGKTELAKTIASYLYGDVERLIRLDMSELSAPDAASRLIGDRFSPGGMLTERIRERPFSVVLLDEIEKAHSSVLYLLLQLFDEGRLTDAAGNSASFQNAVVIMTSNLGARPTRPIGFGEETRGMMADIARAVRDFFPPELFNRIDRVVPFRPLTPEAAEGIVTKELAKLLARRGLRDRDILVYANEAVRRRVVAEAFDPRLGARTVKRYLEDQIGTLLTEQLTSGRRGAMEVFRIYESDGQGAFDVYVDALSEAEPVDVTDSVHRLIDAPAARLKPEAARVLESFDTEAVREQIDAVIEEARSSSRVDELLYFTDVLKESYTEIRAGLARIASGARARPDDPEPFRRMAQADALIRNLDHFGDPAAHIVWIEIARLGSTSGEASVARLFSQVVASYGVAAGDWLEGFAMRLGNGKLVFREHEGCGSALADALRGGPDLITLKVSGLFARDYFAGEAGCHVWQRATGEPVIVRVDMSTDHFDFTVEQRLRRRINAVATFEQALEEGRTPLPENPLALVPAARSLRYDAPLRTGEVFPVRVTDFRQSLVHQFNVRTVGALLERLMTTWLGRTLEVGG